MYGYTGSETCKYSEKNMKGLTDIPLNLKIAQEETLLD